jgi:hypothetical protein
MASLNKKRNKPKNKRSQKRKEAVFLLLIEPKAAPVGGR